MTPGESERTGPVLEPVGWGPAQSAWTAEGADGLVEFALVRSRPGAPYWDDGSEWSLARVAGPPGEIGRPLDPRSFRVSPGSLEHAQQLVDWTVWAEQQPDRPLPERGSLLRRLLSRAAVWARRALRALRAQ